MTKPWKVLGNWAKYSENRIHAPSHQLALALWPATTVFWEQHGHLKWGSPSIKQIWTQILLKIHFSGDLWAIWRLFSWETCIDQTFFLDENSSKPFLRLIADFHFNTVTHPTMQQISSSQPYHGCLKSACVADVGQWHPVPVGQRESDRVSCDWQFETFPNK